MKDSEIFHELGVADDELLRRYRESKLTKSVSATAIFRRCPETISTMLKDGLTNSQIAEFLRKELGKSITGQRVGQILAALDFFDPRRTKSSPPSPSRKPFAPPQTHLPELVSPTSDPYHDPLKDTHLGKDFQTREVETLERRAKYRQQKKTA